MKKLALFIIALFLLITGCCLPESSITVGNDESDTDDRTGNTTISDATKWENDMFNRYYSTDSDQADAVFQAIITAIENQDSAMLKALFSKYAIDISQNMDVEIMHLFDFCEGKMVSFNSSGPGSHSIKEENAYVKEIFASYDFQTTSGDYRMAIRFCTIDSSNPGNIGLRSIYIIQQADSDLNYAYWGGDVWDAGVHIES